MPNLWTAVFLSDQRSYKENVLKTYIGSEFRSLFKANRFTTIFSKKYMIS